MCYAYLSDVQPDITNKFDPDGRLWITQDPLAVSQVAKSKWWTRGWTLQELIAPQIVKFFANGNDGWLEIGDKRSLLDMTASRTGIDRGILCGLHPGKCSIAMRMSWASERETTRIEDKAYCLLGLFGVNMPLLYGEGQKAFLRLQEEIMKQSDDQTLFAWQLGNEYTEADICGPLATSPSQFRWCSDLLPISDLDANTPYSITNKGLRIELPIVQREDYEGGQQLAIAILQCSTAASNSRRLALPLVRITQQESNHYARDARYIGALNFVNPTLVPISVTRTILMKQEPEQSVEWPTGLRIRIQPWLMYNYDLEETSPDLSLAGHSDTNAHDYLVPSGCRRGTIIFVGRKGSHLVVLYDIDLQRIGQFGCKALYCPPRSTQLPDDTEELKQQVLVRNVVYKLNGRRGWELDLNHLHDSFVDSNSRTSILDLPDGDTVSANIAQQTVHGQSTLVLEIKLRDCSEEPGPPYEMDYTTVSDVKKFRRLRQMNPAYSITD